MTHRSHTAQHAVTRPSDRDRLARVVDAAGDVRPAWHELAECVGDRGRDVVSYADAVRAVRTAAVDCRAAWYATQE